jgi:type I restriction enzyme R subunit
LDAEQRQQFAQEFNRVREDFLDTCHGRCVLRRPELAKIVADSLLHFDGERYRMGDFVVMPNHVHLLASFPMEESMKLQCDSWLRK